MKAIAVIIGVLSIASISSCKKCGRCVYDNGTEDQSFCYSDNPNVYNSYKANCEYRTDAKWVMDK